MARSNMSIEPAWALMNGVVERESTTFEVDEHTALNSHMARSTSTQR